MKMTEIGRMLREDGKIEGREAGREEAKIEMARELLKARLLPKKEIAKVSKLSLEKIKEIERDLMSSQMS